MRMRDVTLSLLIAAATGAILFQSCGTGEGGGDADKQEEQTTDGKDVTKPFTVAITGVSVDVPEGVFEAGSKLSVKTADAPGEFTANADVSAASKPVQLAATDASGAAITEVKAPFTLALDLTTAGLAAVDKTAENLCVLNKGADNVIRIWRAAYFKEATATQVKVLTKWMGIYMALYCGQESFPDASSVNKEGTSATSGSTGTASAGYSCQYTATNGGLCIQYSGKANAAVGAKDAVKKTCDDQQNAFSDKGCATDKVLGVCSYNHGTVAEGASFYYEGSTQAQTGAAVLKQSCEGSSTTQANKWFDGATYVATPDTDQKPYTGTDTNTGSNTSTGSNTNTGTTVADECSTTGTQCMASGGAICYNQYATENDCLAANPGATFDGAAKCPTQNRVGCCVNAGVAPSEFDYAMYDPIPIESARSSCSSGGGDLFEDP